MLFMNNFLNDNKLTFNSNNLSHFTSYIGFQYYAVSNLNNLAFSTFKTIVGNRQYTVKFKSKNIKFSSQFRFWLNDFYIDNKNFSSNYSSTMIHCSKLSWLKYSNFKISIEFFDACRCVSWGRGRSSHFLFRLNSHNIVTAFF